MRSGLDKVLKFTWPIIFGLIGMGLMVGVVFSFIDLFKDTGTQILAPGATVVTIEKPGDYTMWHESKTMIDGQFMSFDDDLPSGTTIQVFKKPKGMQIPLRAAGASRMDKGGITRVSVGELHFTQPGEYEVEVTGLSEKRVLYLEEAKFMKSFISIMLYGFGSMLFLIAAVASGVYVLVKLAK